MKAYIIMTHESRQFVSKISPALKGMDVTNSLQVLSDVGDNFGQLAKERIKEADIILIVVDEHLLENANAKTEMQMAMTMFSHNNNPSLFPIILDDTPIPTELNTLMCARCRSNSDTEIKHIGIQLQKVIGDKKDFSLNTRQKSKTSFHKKSDNMIIGTFGITVMMALFASVTPLVLETTASRTDFGSDFTITITAVLIFIAVMMGIYTFIMSISQNKTVEEKEEAEEYSKKLKEAIAPTESRVTIDKLHGNVFIHQAGTEIGEENSTTNAPEIDALGRMLINLEDIKEFYTWSQKQAKGAFRLAVSMCIGGFVMMAVAILLPIAFGLSIEMAVIPAISGAIAELVAGTALFVYRSSLSQLNHYHKALHEDERFLSSVNLLNRFSTTELQDEMLKEVIRSEIKMNLISIAFIDEDIEPKKGEKKESKDKS